MTMASGCGRRFFCIATLLALSACVRLPEGTEAVEGFELERYLGTWYEIARLDHPFERGLTDVTATYSVREDGGVDVVNRGWDTDAGAWDEAEGKAYFVGSPEVGRLKVSFFGPFYGAYNVIELDRENYGWSLVVGPNRDYLWILARDPALPDSVVEDLVAEARRLDFPVDELIRVSHDRAGSR